MIKRLLRYIPWKATRDYILYNKYGKYCPLCGSTIRQIDEAGNGEYECIGCCMHIDLNVWGSISDISIMDTWGLIKKRWSGI